MDKKIRDYQAHSLPLKRFAEVGDNVFRVFFYADILKKKNSVSKPHEMTGHEYFVDGGQLIW
jgi:hypothetical protein